jgi:signal transduction histidine kinase
MINGANRIKVLHKGLVLVLVPMLFEVIFVLVLTASLRNAEYAAWKASHSQAMVSEANDLAVASFRTAMSLLFYASSKHSSFALQYSDQVNQVGEHIKRIRALEVGDPVSRQGLQRLDDLSNKIFELLSSARNIIDSEDKLALEQFSWRTDLARLLKQLMSETDHFIKYASDVKRIDLETQDRNRNIVIACIICGLTVNIALAAALVSLFSAGIVKRMKVMIDNTTRVAHAQELNPIVDGSDEIAELDRFIHQMADDLRISEERRKELLAMVSHDLRSPIVAVNGSLLLLLRNVVGQVDDKVRKELERAERNTRRLILLINDLLDIEKIASGKLEVKKSWSSVDEIFDESMNSLKGMGDQKGVKIQLAKTHLRIFADAPRIVQVVVNLCSNAIKFSPERGTIFLNANRLPDAVELSVTDQGKGIDAEFKQKLFGRFEQNKGDSTASVGSSGLGLYICKNLVGLHEGTIGVDSEPGHGSKFWFRIPIPPAGEDQVEEEVGQEMTW